MLNTNRQYWAQMIAGTILLMALVGCSGGTSSGGGGGTTLQAPTAKVGGPYSGVAGAAVTFSGGGSSDPQSQVLTYAWNFGDGGTGTGVSPTHTYAAAGMYTVSLTVTDTSSLSSAASTTTATILGAPTAKAGGPYSGVAGAAVTFSGSGSSDPQSQALTYAWTFGDGGTGTGVSPTHSYAAAGTYTVSLTVADTSSLTGTAMTTVSIGLAPSFALSASPQSVALTAGTSAVVDLLVTAQNGFAGTVVATPSGLPSGVTAGSSSYTLTPGVVTQMTLNAGSSLANAVTQVTVAGTSGSLLSAAYLMVTTGTAADYTVTTSAAAVSLAPGGSQTMTVTANAVNGFTGSVMGEFVDIPVGVTVTPATFTLPLGSAVTVTLAAGSSAVAGNTELQVNGISGTTVHIVPVEMNVKTVSQDFVLAAPVSLTVAASGTATMDVQVAGVSGFVGNVAMTVSGLPTGVTASPSSFTVSCAPGGTSSQSVTLTGGSSIAAATAAFTVAGTATSGTGASLSHQNSVVLTTAPTSAVAAAVSASTPGATFPSYFVGLSMPASTLQEFTGTGATTYSSFISLLSNLEGFVGAPSFRSTLQTSSSGVSELAALTSAKNTGFALPWVSPKYFLTTSSSFTLATDATYVQSTINAVGSSNVLGLELDNEPDLYVSNGYRPVGWTYADYLTETASYQSAFAQYVTAPQLVATAASGQSWNVGIPALTTQMSGQLAAFTEHEYALTACGNTPTIAQLLQDKASHGYYGRYAALVQTLGTVPVRVGEMNSVSCSGYAGVSNAFAASLWLVDTAFESAAAGTVGFNLHSGGTSSNGAQPYDIGFSNNGSLSVYAPFYGMLFFAEAIQNGAKMVPVTVTKTSGNVKVWATIDASRTVRVVVLEKDTDGIANSKTVALNLGSAYTQAGTLTTMSAASVGATSGISIAGQTFDGTTNGMLAGTPNTSTVTGSGGIYTITVPDGTAAMLTVP